MWGRVVYTIAVSDCRESENFLDEAALYSCETAGIGEVVALDQEVVAQFALIADEVLAIGVAHHQPVER